MKKAIQNSALIIASCLAALTLVEGARTLYLGKENHISLLSQTLWRYSRSKEKVEGEKVDTRMRDSFLNNRDELASMLPLLKSIDAGLGNTDFRETMTKRASLNGGPICQGMKPKIQRQIVQLRSSIFENLNPPVIFFDNSVVLPQELKTFIDKYAFSKKIITSNEAGERVTIPTLKKNKKVLIAGDSVALGMGVNDDETLASRMQQTDRSRQFVNLGVSGASTKEITCLLESAEQRYKIIDELIYILCDNDLYSNVFVDPQIIVEFLKKYQERNKIRKVTIVRSPFLYEIPPVFDRDFRENSNVVQLKQKSEAAGFLFRDVTDLALAEAEKENTIFGAYSFYLDKYHLSPSGTKKLAQVLLQ